MSRQAYYFHLAFWPLAFAVWLFSKTEYHPTWTLRIACTFMLTLMSALFACCFIPRRASVAAVAKMVFGLLACGSGAAIAIHFLYDSFVGPDPRRFAFSSNLIMDTTIVAFNTAVAALTAFIVHTATGRPTWLFR